MTPRERGRTGAIEEAKELIRGEHALALRTDHVLDLLDRVLAAHNHPRKQRATRRTPQS